MSSTDLIVAILLTVWCQIENIIFGNIFNLSHLSLSLSPYCYNHVFDRSDVPLLICYLRFNEFCAFLKCDLVLTKRCQSLMSRRNYQLNYDNVDWYCILPFLTNCNVQIGHNVIIGSGCMLCGQVGIAGSATYVVHIALHLYLNLWLTSRFSFVIFHKYKRVILSLVNVTWGHMSQDRRLCYFRRQSCRAGSCVNHI